MTKVECEARGAKAREPVRSLASRVTVRRAVSVGKGGRQKNSTKLMPNGDPPSVMLWGSEE